MYLANPCGQVRSPLKKNEERALFKKRWAMLLNLKEKEKEKDYVYEKNRCLSGNGINYACLWANNSPGIKKFPYFVQPTFQGVF
jgi:hypothetical protein